MVQSIVYFSGAETGDLSELTAPVDTVVQSSDVISGGYSFTVAGGQMVPVGSLGATQVVWRWQMKMLGSFNTGNWAREQSVSGTTRLALKCSASSNAKIRVADSGTTLGLTQTDGLTVLNLGQVYTVELALDLAAGGIIRVWINGKLEIDTTHTNDVSAAPSNRISFVGSATAWVYDDFAVATGGISQIGPGRCIARQGKAGTPTYDAWTKTGAATAALCLSDTPFSATTNCNSTTSAAAQTMLVAPFSQVQAGHGTEVVSPIDVINACKTAVIAKRATSGNPSIRRRIGGSDTDTAKAVTTADLYYDDGIWTTTPANLDTAEIGMVKAADANSTTMEDAWLMADVTPVWFPPSVDCHEASIIRPGVEMVAY